MTAPTDSGPRQPGMVIAPGGHCLGQPASHFDGTRLDAAVTTVWCERIPADDPSGGDQRWRLDLGRGRIERDGWDALDAALCLAPAPVDTASCEPLLQRAAALAAGRSRRTGPDAGRGGRALFDARRELRQCLDRAAGNGPVSGAPTTVPCDGAADTGWRLRASSLRSDGRCIAERGARAVLAACGDGEPPWQLTADDTISDGRRCLERVGDGPSIAVAACSSSAAQQFRLGAAGSLVAAGGDRCLTGLGDDLRAGPCASSDRFYVSAQIESARAPGSCLAIVGDTASPAATVVMAACADDQRFELHP